MQHQKHKEQQQRYNKHLLKQLPKPAAKRSKGANEEAESRGSMDTHARAAGVAFKALGVATAFTGVATGVVLAGAWALGIDSAESLRRGLRGATRDAIAATGADGISRSQKQRQGR